MTPEKRNALTVAGTGLSMSLAAFLINGVLAPGPRIAQMLSMAISFGGGILVLGCILLARAKGRPWWHGLLGMLSCIGLGVLWMLPDRPR